MLLSSSSTTVVASNRLCLLAIMRRTSQMRQTHHAISQIAREMPARIVLSCIFDMISSDARLIASKKIYVCASFFHPADKLRAPTIASYTTLSRVTCPVRWRLNAETVGRDGKLSVQRSTGPSTMTTPWSRSRVHFLLLRASKDRMHASTTQISKTRIPTALMRIQRVCQSVRKSVLGCLGMRTASKARTGILG